MQSFDWFFRQKVTESELGAAFDGVENAVDRIYEDLGLIGIIYQAAVSEHSPTPNLTVDVQAGIVIDQLGQRIYWSSLQNVDVSVDENGSSTAVGGAPNEKWLSLFAKFKRVQTVPKVDGNQETVYFDQAEGFEFKVVQGTEAPPSATKPALRSDQILLADIKLIFGQTSVLNADINTDRREWAIQASSTSVDIDRGQLEDALQDLADAIEVSDTALATHKASAANEHLATAVDYAGGGTWHSGTANPATTVEAQLDKVITDLSKDTSPAGANQIGAQAQGAPFALSSGSVQDQLGELKGHISTVNTVAISNTWHDGSGISATDVEAATEEIVADLDNDAGSDRIGSAAEAFGVLNLGAGSIYDQLGDLLALVAANLQRLQQLRAENWDVWVACFDPGNEGQGVAFCRENGVHRYVFVGDDGSTTAEIFASRSGIGRVDSCILGGSLTTRLFDVTWDSNNSYFVAVGQRGATGADIQYDADGTGTWTQHGTHPWFTTANAVLRSVIFDLGTPAVIAAGYNGTTGKILIASDPTSTWSSPTTEVTADSWLSLATKGNGLLVVVGDKTSTSFAAYSSDGGVNWWDGSAGLSGTALTDVCYDLATDSFYASGKGGKIFRSADYGHNWSDVSPGGFSGDIIAIASDGQGTILATGGGTSPRTYITQNEGVSWGWFATSKGGETANWTNPRTLYFEGGRFFQFDTGDNDIYYSLKFGTEGLTS